MFAGPGKSEEMPKADPVLTPDQALEPKAAALRPHPLVGTTVPAVKKWMESFPVETQQLSKKILELLQEQRYAKETLQSSAAQYGIPVGDALKLSSGVAYIVLFDCSRSVVEAPAQPAEPVEEQKPEAAATEEPNVSAEVGGPAPAAEPATAAEGGEASPTAEAVAGPAPSTQPVEEKPEAAATEEPRASAEAAAYVPIPVTFLPFFWDFVW
eukprot:s3_g64.t2